MDRLTRHAIGEVRDDGKGTADDHPTSMSGLVYRNVLPCAKCGQVQV